MMLIIEVVVDAMSPETLLPKGRLSISPISIFLCKPALNNAPATRIIPITFREVLEAVDVFR